MKNIIITEGQYLKLIRENSDDAYDEFQRALQKFQQQGFELSPEHEQQFQKKINTMYRMGWINDIRHIRHELLYYLRHKYAPKFWAYYFAEKEKELEAREKYAKEGKLSPKEIVEQSIKDLVRRNTKVNAVRLDYLEQFSHADREKNPMADLDKLQKDIMENGFQRPAELWRDRNGYAVLWEGNHRLAVAKRLGLDYMPVTLEDMGPNGDAESKNGAPFDYLEFKENIVRV